MSQLALRIIQGDHPKSFEVGRVFRVDDRHSEGGADAVYFRVDGQPLSLPAWQVLILPPNLREDSPELAALVNAVREIEQPASRADGEAAYSKAFREPYVEWREG